jgi:hypothetical protein
VWLSSERCCFHLPSFTKALPGRHVVTFPGDVGCHSFYWWRLGLVGRACTVQGLSGLALPYLRTSQLWKGRKEEKLSRCTPAVQSVDLSQPQ